MNNEKITKDNITEVIESIKNIPDLENIPKRYEIHIGNKHYNYWFSIIECIDINKSITIANQIKLHDEKAYIPNKGVYASSKDAAVAGLMTLKQINPNTDINVEIKNDN